MAPVALLLLPLAAGYFLSYLFRTINAVMAGSLTAELGLGAADLGTLTAAYFFAFAAAQLPLGALLDRFGPRRVQGVLLSVAAGGSFLFARAHTLPLLMLGRGLIGLGVATALMAGLKAITLSLPSEQAPSANGWFVMLGALGAVAGTSPAEAAIAWLGWRPIFILLACATAATAALILLVVPEPKAAPRLARGGHALLASFVAIYCDPRFLRLAPLSASCVGSAWAMQGLWAAPWLADVEGLDHQGVVRHLLVMGIALSAGALILGALGRRLRRLGMPLSTLLGATAAVFIAAQLALICRVPLSSYFLWSIIAAVGAVTVLSYAVVSEAFPPAMTGRANGSLNLLHMSAAFIVQTGLGLIIARWPVLPGGHYPAAAYRDAFLANCLVQVAALVWFAWPLRSRRPAVAPLSYDRIAGNGT